MRDVLVVKLTTTTETGKFVNGQSDMVKGDQQPEPDIQESEIEVPECCHWPIPGIAALPPPTTQPPMPATNPIAATRTHKPNPSTAPV